MAAAPAVNFPATDYEMVLSRRDRCPDSTRCRSCFHHHGLPPSHRALHQEQHKHRQTRISLTPALHSLLPTPRSLLLALRSLPPALRSQFPAPSQPPPSLERFAHCLRLIWVRRAILLRPRFASPRRLRTVGVRPIQRAEVNVRSVLPLALLLRHLLHAATKAQTSSYAPWGLRPVPLQHGPPGGRLKDARWKKRSLRAP